MVHFNIGRNNDVSILDKLQATLASYWGHLIHADSYGFRQSVLTKHQWLNEYFVIDGNLLMNHGANFVPRYKTPKLWNRIADQYNYFTNKYHGIVVLFEVGQYIEFYRALEKDLLELLKLNSLKENKRGALYGFPKRHLKRYKNIIEQSGKIWITIYETGRIVCGIKERIPFERIYCAKVA